MIDTRTGRIRIFLTIHRNILIFQDILQKEEGRNVSKRYKSLQQGCCKCILHVAPDITSRRLLAAEAERRPYQSGVMSLQVSLWMSTGQSG